MLSIIIPMYNVEDKICRTIDSIVKQDVEEYELIIVDDCSKDNSYNICKRYIEDKKIENAIILKNEENHGPSYTRNRGMKVAKGEYCVLLDSDDYYEENAINLMLDNMKPKSLVVTGIKYIYKRNKVKYLLYGEKDKITNVEDDIFIDFHMTGLLNQPSNKMYDLKLIKENDIWFNESSSYGEDIEFNFRYMEKISDIVYINKPLYVYTETKKGLNNTYKENELSIAKANFQNKIKYFKDRFNIDENAEENLYKIYISERIRFYYRFNKYDNRENKKEYLLKTIEEDDIEKLLKKANLNNLNITNIMKLIKMRMYFCARIYYKIFI